jgi:cytochrome c oxidase assembly factor CtaG
MNPILWATLTSWDLRVEVILILATAGILYTLGWWRLRKRTRLQNTRSRWQLGAWWRPAIYLGGLILLAIALMSPIDVLGAQLFTMHMVQHVLLVMLIPPLILLANPLPFLLWGMPGRTRLAAGRWLGRKAGLRRVLLRVTGPGWVWLVFVIIYWGWHDPAVYVLALENRFVHDLEHITFFLISMLYWWHIISAGPRIHRPLPPLARIGYLLAAIPPTMLAGIAIAFANQPIYSYYEAVPRIWGLSALEDQRIAGVIMWVPGSMMYMVAILILANRWLQTEAKKPSLPEKNWATDKALTAPGWKD